MICKGFRTTATSAALTLAGIPPLYHRATQEAATTRILQLRQDATFNGHTFSPTSYEHLRHHSRQHPGDKGKGVIISIPKAPSSNITSAHPVYYTDGSKQDAGVGSAFLLTHHNEVITSWKGHLQPHNSIFQAEALAILKAIAHAARFNYRSPIICTDSQSTLHAIKNHRHTSPIIKDIQSLLQQHRSNPARLIWVKAHVGLAGNEAADALANEAATNHEAIEVNLPAPSSYLKSQLTRATITAWQRDWDSCDTGRRAHIFLPKVSTSRLCSIPPLTRFITGHGPFPTYYHRHGISTTDICICGQEGNPNHYLFACPLTSAMHLPEPTTDLDAFLRFTVKNRAVVNKICQMVNYLATQGQDVCHPT
ncbi:uncharacterized protein LOC118199857 [Stegodyphus dumicola]|uniref:uncharacterized protein LOC118199857 n=1 Tax=Stegodyphus dumicola TaxID=202533 RepID=UPI0015AD4C79|nr:uncharacterized protein LOC118199857 [Stegodyphus dumicola]